MPVDVNDTPTPHDTTRRRAGDTMWMWRTITAASHDFASLLAALQEEASKIRHWEPSDFEGPGVLGSPVAKALDLVNFQDAIARMLAHPAAGEDFHRWLIREARASDCNAAYHVLMLSAATRALRDGLCSTQIYLEVAAQEELTQEWNRLLRLPPTPESVRALVALRHPPPPPQK